MLIARANALVTSVCEANIFPSIEAARGGALLERLIMEGERAIARAIRFRQLIARHRNELNDGAMYMLTRLARVAERDVWGF